MKNFKNIVLSLTAIILLTSCKTSKSVLENCQNVPSELNIENINGTYKGKELWNHFYRSKSTKKDTTQLVNNITTEIFFNGKDEIRASVYDDGIKKNEIILKAKIYKDYISVKKRHKLIPLIPLYFESEVYKIMLATNAENNLTVCGYNSHYIVIVIISGGKDGYFSNTFERIK